MIVKRKEFYIFLKNGLQKIMLVIFHQLLHCFCMFCLLLCAPTLLLCCSVLLHYFSLPCVLCSSFFNLLSSFSNLIKNIINDPQFKEFRYLKKAVEQATKTQEAYFTQYEKKTIWRKPNFFFSDKKLISRWHLYLIVLH